MTDLQATLKRSFDILASVLGLVALWPLIVFCIFIARAQSSSNGIFSQRRIGRNGKLFKVYKIRTMFTDGESDFGDITLENDPRITKSGAWMRKYKIDELPQLFNILLGDMSLVGPRPDVPGYADLIEGEKRRILNLRPGITGPATIKYKYEERLLAQASDPKYFNDVVIYPDKLKINLEYLENYSLVKDLRYILMTLGLISIDIDIRPLSIPPASISANTSNS